MANKNQYQIGVAITANGTQAKRTISEVEGSMKRLGSTTRAALASFAGNVGANAFSAITSYAQQAGTELLRYSAKIESTKVAFESLSGSAAFATKHMADLQKFSVKNALPLEPLLKMSQRLQGAGVAGRDVLDILTNVGNVAAATGDLGTERLEGISTALSQIISKGKLSAEEMEQLAERGIPAWKLLSESMGVSVGELRKMGEEGKLTSKDLLKAFDQLAKNKYGDAMKRQAETGMGAFVGLKNAITVAAATAFEPYYQEIAKFAQRMLKEVQEQEGDISKIGEVIAKYTGEGFAKASETVGTASAKFLYDTLADRIEFIFSDGKQGRIMDTMSAYFTSTLTKSFLRAIGATEKQLQGVDFITTALTKGTDEAAKAYHNAGTYLATMGRFDSSQVNPGQLYNSINAINTAVNKMPSVAEALELTKAERQADKLTNQFKSVNNSISDMIRQVQFYGDETEVAATKQKLMSDGIYDFNSELAKSSLFWANYLDKLKAGKEAQDKYNSGLKSAKDELTSIREAAEFEINFADASDLDKFNDQIRKGAFGFKELSFEIEQTRQALKDLAQQRAIGDAVKDADAFRKSITDTIQTLQGSNLSDFGQSIRSAIGSLTLTDSRGNKLDPNQVSRDIELIIGNASAAMQDAPSGNFLDKLTQSFKDLKIQASDGTDLGLLLGGIRSGSDVLSVIDLYNEFAKQLKQGEVKQGLTELEGVLSDLGLTIAGRGFKDDLEQLNELLSDPSVTLAIEKEAKAIGITAQAYKDLIRQKKAAQMAGGTRERYAGAKKTGFDRNTLSGGIFGSEGVSRLRDEAAQITSVYQLMGNTIGGVIEGMVGAGQNLLATYILTGEAGAEAFKQLAAEAISALVVQAGIKAIFEMAEGFAALGRYDPVSATAHFTSAKIYGAVALAAGAAALAIGAAGGLSGGGDREDQSGAPDYQTAASSNVQTTGQNFNVNANLDVTKLASAVDGLNNRISSMSPGDVLTTGASQKKGFIANTTVNEMKTNPSARSGMNRVLGNV